MDANEGIPDVVMSLHNDHGHMISDYLMSFFPFKSLLKEQHLFFFFFNKKCKFLVIFSQKKRIRLVG
jgi:hypothetical protein